MDAEKRNSPKIRSEISKEQSIDQEIVIRPDGRVEIEWITPEATRLVLEVYRVVSAEPFPVRVISGNLYCG